MTKTLLSGVAAMAFAFAAPTAFAQDSHVESDNDAKMKTEQMIEKAEKTADELEDTTDELEESSEKMWDAEDSEINDTDDTVDEDVDTDIDSEGYVTPLVDCPDDTTVQPDGTCMAIGEWTPDN